MYQDMRMEELGNSKYAVNAVHTGRRNINQNNNGRNWNMIHSFNLHIGMHVSRYIQQQVLVLKC